MALGQLLLLGWGVRTGLQIVSDDPKIIRLPLPARVILSLSLLMAAFLISLSLRSTLGYLVLFGMILSFFGDLFNAEVIPLPVPLIGGMIAFGAAHFFYIAAFIFLLKLTDTRIPPYFWIILAAVWLITAISWRLFIRNPEKLAVLNLGSLFYALLIGTMFTFALTASLELGGWWWTVSSGALLFFVSDTIIGITNIGRIEMKKPHLWIWLTYVLGQMGIVYGVWIGLAM